MTSPFESDDKPYVVLVNDENQHSLWPVANDVPAGWKVVFGPGARASCLDYVSAHWIDIRPRSLIDRDQPRA